MKLASTITLPAVGLTGFETPLDEEERVIQHSVHRFARDVLRPLGRELDRMSAEEVAAPGSPSTSISTSRRTRRCRSTTRTSCRGG